MTSASPQDSMSRKNIFFVHVPKCGGTALGACLASNFSCTDRELRAEGVDWRETAPLKLLMGGHCRRPEIDQTGRYADYSFITMLREPLDRFMSGLNYRLNFQSPTSDIGDIKADDIKRNGVAWMVEKSRDTPSSHKFLYNKMFHVTRPHAHPNDGDPNGILDAYRAFGLQERMTDSILLMSYKTGLVPFLLRSKVNKTGKIYFDTADCDLDEFIDLDRPLYDAAVRRFDDEYHAMVEDICQRSKVSTSQFLSKSDPEKVEFLETYLVHANTRHLQEKADLCQAGTIQYYLQDQHPAQRGEHLVETAEFVVKGTSLHVLVQNPKRDPLVLKLTTDHVYSDQFGEHITASVNGHSVKVGVTGRCIEIPLTGGAASFHVTLIYSGDAMYEALQRELTTIPYDVVNVAFSLKDLSVERSL